MTSIPPSTIAVIYLARKAEGLKTFHAFLQSYQTYPAGIPHDLVILFKGFEGGSDLEEAQALFSSVPFISLELPDEGFDIGSYFTATKQLNHEYVCFLNTFSRILADDWLLKFYTHASSRGVGIVGATGSYEGAYTTMTLGLKVSWLNAQPSLDKNLRLQLQQHFEYILKNPKIELRKASLIDIVKFVVKTLLALIPGWNSSKILHLRYLIWWKNTQKKEKFLKSIHDFPPFPNPHIRSTAFMINRLKFLALKTGPFHTKIDACLFESGPISMTRQILGDGLKALIVDKNGKIYDVPEWPNSKTFRLSNQENLLIADKQTDFFTQANERVQHVHVLITWKIEKILDLFKSKASLDLDSLKDS